MLVGKELLEKSKLLSKKSEDEIARGCGYVGPSGRVLRKTSIPGTPRWAMLATRSPSSSCPVQSLSRRLPR